MDARERIISYKISAFEEGVQKPHSQHVSAQRADNRAGGRT
jgi:hypothetical protein